MRALIILACVALAAAVYAYENWWPRTETHDYAVGAEDEVVAPYPCRLRDAVPAASLTASSTVRDSERAVASRGAPAATSEEGGCWWQLTDERGSGRGPQQRRRRENHAQSNEEWARDAWGIAPVVFTAHTPGVARFVCDGATFVVRVHAPARVALKSPTRVAVGERFTPTLTVVAADGTALELGRYATIDWTFTGAIRGDNPGGCEFPPWCGRAPAGATWAVGTAPGTGRVTGTFAGLAATVAVDVTAGDR